MAITITGVGSCIPEKRVKNSDFLGHEFIDKKGVPIDSPNDVIVEKFECITGIRERRYAEDNQVTSDMATIAAEKAIKDAGVNPEELDYLIVGQNFGDIKHGSHQTDQVPSLASRVKHNLRIKNPSCVAYDVVFGCPGWLEGMIQAQAFIRAGMAKKCLVIGAEALSRVVDCHDRDTMIFADGAGATILEKTDGSNGVLAHVSASHTYSESLYLNYDCSYHKEKAKDKVRYIKMAGRKIYNFSLTKVPQAMKDCLDKSGYPIEKLKKIFIHQANEKMDDAICERFFKLYDMKVPEHIMPMSIHELGNSSVATLPTLLDMVRRDEFQNHQVEKGDIVMFASVGAGMNINAMIYQV